VSTLRLGTSVTNKVVRQLSLLHCQPSQDYKNDSTCCMTLLVPTLNQMANGASFADIFGFTMGIQYLLAVNIAYGNV
jgi:hypothetical protein